MGRLATPQSCAKEETCSSSPARSTAWRYSHNSEPSSRLMDVSIESSRPEKCSTCTQKTACIRRRSIRAEKQSIRMTDRLARTSTPVRLSSRERMHSRSKSTNTTKIIYSEKQQQQQDNC